MTDGQEAGGPGDVDDWIGARVALAVAAKPIADETAESVKTAMRTKMADRTLPPGELAKLAKELLAILGGGAK